MGWKVQNSAGERAGSHAGGVVKRVLLRLVSQGP
jgi:hypothetical protein